MGQTCKRMQQLAGHYFREYFPELLYFLLDEKVRILYPNPYNMHIGTDFYRFITKLCIRDQLDYFLEPETFASLKTLGFNALELTHQQIQFCRNILKDVENLLLCDCQIQTGDIFEQIANYCPKIKYLYVKNLVDSAIITDELFSSHYRTLEHIIYDVKVLGEVTPTDELKKFLEKHTNLRHFECYDHFLWINRSSLVDTNVQLDQLTIYLRTESIAGHWEQFADFLQQLYQRGFYKKLRLLADLWDVDLSADNFINLPGLEKLCIDGVDRSTSVSRLTDLNELHVCDMRYPIPVIDTVVKSLANLEQLNIKSSWTIDDASPFICHSMKLKIIKLDEWSENVALDLYALNDERKKHANACQIVIYMPEPIYLREKWQSKNLHLSHIKIARSTHFYLTSWPDM